MPYIRNPFGDSEDAALRDAAAAQHTGGVLGVSATTGATVTETPSTVPLVKIAVVAAILFALTVSGSAVLSPRT
jgi:hypothetical protein